MAEHASESRHLDPEQQEQASEHAPLSAMVIHEVIRHEGKEEIDRDAGQLLASGLAAGLSMGFSFLVEAQIQAALPDTPWRHVVAAFGYTIGFVIVVLGRQQLFTESTLTAVLPVFTDRKASTGLRCLRVWGFVLLANLVGTWIFAAALHYGHVVRPETLPALQQLADQSMAEPFWPTLIKAVFAGSLIALMVWLLPSSRSARLFVIVLLTWVVALGQYSHIIAGSSEAAFAVLSGHAGFGDYLLKFIAPTLIGNTLGGVLIVALLNHAPVAADMK